ncbi:DUF2165 family protein [Lonsdalea quercina]|uniref:DUF2165 family protein n=1 Tax=Lonsdalea quercina TaxID=71657 RepID=UPI003975E833
MKHSNTNALPFTTLTKLLYLYGFGMWMTIITFNNINDPETNIIFIKNMIEMNLFKPEAGVGAGLQLLWRAIKAPYLAGILLWGVVIVELVIDFLMWRAFLSVLACAFRKEPLGLQTLKKVNLALSAMLFLFMMFITGGMWFAYWINQGAFQMVHLTAITITMLGLIYFNQDHFINNESQSRDKSRTRK